jgi:FAD/FMN-containing dehydrogenase
LVCEQFGLPAPLPTTAGAMLLVECVGDTDVDPSAALAEAVDGLPGVLDAAVAIDAAGRERLWAYREGHTEAVARLGRPLKLDVAVPLPALPDAERELRAFVAERAPGARLYLWGHLAEGNLHINIVRPGDRPAAGATGPIAATAATGPTAATGAGASGGTGAFDLGDDTLADGLLRLVAAYGGSIGAEHGVGRAKVRWVGLSRGEAERAVLRLVKRALDPLGLMNPGVLVPPYGVGAYAAGVPRPS